MRKPTRQEMAAEFRARAKAHREARLKEAAALADIRTGNLESIFGRIVLPGEHPSTAPVGRSGFSVPAGRFFTRPSMRTTHSARTVSASRKAGESGSATHCVRP